MGNPLAGLPRRQVLGYGVASLALAGTAFAEEKNGFEPLPAQIRLTSGHLTTPVRINGKGPFHFIVDTGADRSVIADDVAEALHLPLGRQVVVQGIIRAVPAQTVPVAEMRFGAAVREKMELPVLPRKLLQADGFLGLDAIGDHRVEFDFQRRALRVVESLPAQFARTDPNEARIEANGAAAHLRSTECRVDGALATAFIDSGAEVSVGNEALRRALMELDPGHTPTRDVELTGITGGSRTGRVLKVDTILFGTLEFSGCEIAIADLDVFKVWDLTDKPAMLIGLNFLKEFQTVSVDFRRKEYRLRVASASTPWVTKRG